MFEKSAAIIVLFDFPVFIDFRLCLKVTWFHVGSILVPRALLDRVTGEDRFYKHFVPSLAPLGLHFGSLLGPFWPSLGYLGRPRGGSHGKGREMSAKCLDFGTDLGSISSSKTGPQNR